MSSMFKAILRQMPAAIGGAIVGAATKAGDLMGQAMVLPTKMAFEAVISEMKDVFNAFNPGLQMVKAFNEFNRVQERMAAANLSRDKLLEKARGDELKILKGSLVETTKSMATNFEAGLKPNNVGLLKLQETMRFTGQRTESLMKSMVNLSYSTGGNQASIDGLIRSSDRLRDQYGISSEKLFDAVSKLDKESLDVAALYGESPMLAEIGQSLTAMTAGQIPQEQLNAVIRLFYLSDNQNFILRQILGIQEGFLQSLGDLAPEKRDAAFLAEIRRVFNVLQTNFGDTGNRHTDTQIRTDLRFEQVQTALLNLSKINLENRKNLVQELEGRVELEQADNTMIARLEKAQIEMQESMAKGLDDFRNVMIQAARSLNLIPTEIIKALMPFKQAFVPAGAGQNATAFENPPNAQGQANFNPPDQKDLDVIAKDIFESQDTLWDTTKNQVESFVKTFGKAGNKFNDYIKIQDLINNKSQDIVDEVMSYRDSWHGYAPFADEVVPSQIKDDYESVMFDTIEQLQESSLKLPENIRESYLQKSLDALGDVDIRDLMGAIKNNTTPRFQALLAANNTQNQVNAIIQRSNILTEQYAKLMRDTETARKKSDQKELDQLTIQLRNLSELIADENLIRRNVNLQAIDLGHIPGVGGY